MNYLKDKAEGLLTWFSVNFKWLPILCWRHATGRLYIFRDVPTNVLGSFLAVKPFRDGVCDELIMRASKLQKTLASEVEATEMNQHIEIAVEQFLRRSK